MPFTIEKGLGSSQYRYDISITRKPIRTIYLLIDDSSYPNSVVYVGQSETNFFNRLNSHVNDEYKKFNRVFAFNLRDSDFTLDQVEHALISYYNPKYNKALKGDVTQKDFIVMTYFISNLSEYLKNEPNNKEQIDE
jgi:hypothetical protein